MSRAKVLFTVFVVLAFISGMIFSGLQASDLLFARILAWLLLFIEALFIFLYIWHP